MPAEAKEAAEPVGLATSQDGAKPRNLHVMICSPVLGDMKTGAAWALSNAKAYFAVMEYDGDKKVGWEICKSSNLCEGRTRLVSRAFDQGATHILWWDSDIKARVDVIPALLNHNKPIVALNYPTKDLNSRPTAYKDDEEFVGPLWTREESTGLVEVSHAGMGCMLVECSVYDALDLPYFHFEPMAPDFVKTGGEDVYFCRKAREAGFKIFVDHDLSKSVAHIGDFEYTNFWTNEAETVRQKLYQDLP